MTRKELAHEHHKQVLREDKGEIKASVESSGVYSPQSLVPRFEIREVDNDCLSAAIEVINCGYEEMDVTILNFASFTQPGGGYMNGAMAQEESLCSESNLWEILNDEKFKPLYEFNRDHRNSGLYEHRAIFTPDVKFTRNGKTYFINVLTCAAPNYNYAVSQEISGKAVMRIYEERVRFLYDILQKQRQMILIAGAWGCGVFGCPLEQAKELFKKHAKMDTVLAIPSSPNFKPQRSIC